MNDQKTLLIRAFVAFLILPADLRLSPLRKDIFSYEATKGTKFHEV